MAYEHKNNTGTLFKNDRKEKDTHPNAKGRALIDGKWYWVSAWTKTGKGGDKFQSLSFQLMERQPQEQGEGAPPLPKDFDEDSVPF